MNADSDHVYSLYLDAIEGVQKQLDLPPKPPFRSPCNHCGLCCISSLCEAARALNPLDSAPCQHLRLIDGKALCGLVLTEQENGLVPLVRLGLGIGTGCSMGDRDTTDAERDAFHDEVRTLLAPAFAAAQDEARRMQSARANRKVVAQ